MGSSSKKTYRYQSDSDPSSESKDTLHCTISNWNTLQKNLSGRQESQESITETVFFKKYDQTPLLVFSRDTSTLLPN